jgi:hypothetical protein
MELSKYVVSLTREGREQNLYREVERVLRETPSLEILEGAGRKVFTVTMPRQMRDELAARLSHAVISPYQELELLSVSR